jgi:hypothetical protein
MGALVGSKVTEVTALELCLWASSDVVFLGRKRQAESQEASCLLQVPLSDSTVHKSE